MLVFHNVTVHGCGVKILDDLTFELPKRGTAIILGPSGCGKTTLLRTTVREDEDDPDLEFSGKITLGGRDVRDPSFLPTALRQRVGLISQRPVPFPGTAFENVTLALRCTTKLSRRQIESHARRALDEVGLEAGHFDSRADRLSGGQLRRLSIARTIALDPSVILMDEPSNGLDPLAAARLEQLVKKLARKRLVVVVTHDMALAGRIADAVFFLWPYPQGCRLVEQGSAEAVLERPRRPETRLFVEAARLGAAAANVNDLRDQEAEECMPRRIEIVDTPKSRTKGVAS